MRTQTKRVAETGEFWIASSRMRAMFDAIPDGVLVLDKTGEILFVNRSAAAHIGCYCATGGGCSFDDLFERFWISDMDGTLLSAEQWPAARVLRGESLSDVELYVMRRDTSQTWIINFSGEPIIEPEGYQSWAVVVARDITSRKKMEQELKRTAERLSLAQQAGRVGVFDWDMVSNQAVWTPELEEIYGISPGSFEHRYEGWAKRVHPEDLPCIEKLFEDWANSGRDEEQWEYRFMRNGEKRWISARGRIFRDGFGKPLRMIGTNLDITDRKRAEEALQENRDLLTIFVEHAPAALAMFDTQMRYLMLSRRWRTDFLVGDRNLVGMSHYDFFPDLPERWKEAHRRGLAGEVVRADGDCFERADGSTYWSRWELLPWYTSEGKVGGIIIFSEDITELKRSEEQLRELNQRLTYHIENSPLAVVELGPDMRVVRWSGAAESIFGYEAGEVVGKPMGELRIVHGDDEPLVEAVFSELAAGKKTRLFSFNRNYRKDGSIVYCEWYNSSLLDDAGNLRSILCLGHDVSDRKRLEDSLERYRETLEQKVAERTSELREKDQLLLQQSRLAAMGEMINNIAHQWRQPLNVLGLMFQNFALSFENGNLDEAAVWSATGEAMKLIGHMSQTIDDFRNFFRPRKEKSVFSVKEAIEMTVSLVKDGFKNSEILIEAASVEDVKVSGYFNEFCQVILNIMQNGRDAIMERNATDRRILIASAVDGSRAVVTIADRAGGIAPDLLEKIFEPYFSTKGVQGTGIGLYMSKNIIETSMGGKLSVRNREGGAEFRIEVARVRGE